LLTTPLQRQPNKQTYQSDPNILLIAGVACRENIPPLPVAICEHIFPVKSSDSEGKYQLHKTFREMEAFFEKRIRNAHAENSARDIRYYNELSFLDSATREVMALVSEAHCATSSEVYEEAIPPHGRLIHKKQISILLRLSDLLDMNS